MMPFYEVLSRISAVVKPNGKYGVARRLGMRRGVNTLCGNDAGVADVAWRGSGDQRGVCWRMAYSRLY